MNELVEDLGRVGKRIEGITGREEEEKLPDGGPVVYAQDKTQHCFGVFQNR